MGAKLGAIRCGLLWTAVDSDGIERPSLQPVGTAWTAVDGAWRSTDQKVGGSSPSGCAVETLAPQGVRAKVGSLTF